MLLFVAGLIAATFASGVWCAGALLAGPVRAWWRAGRPVAPGAILLAVALAVATGLRFFLVPPHHAMYLDEPWYAEAACNLGRLGRLVLCEETSSGAACIPYAKAPGWPVLLAPWTILLGCDTAIGIEINRVLGTATVLLVALAARCAGARWWQAAAAAMILAIHPVHVAWSATGETNVAAAAMLLVGLCGAIVFARTARACGGALAVSAMGLSTAIRPESLLPAAAAALMLALAARASLRRRLVVAAALGMVCAAAAAAGLQLWTMNESISGGAFLSLGDILLNARLVVGEESLRVHGVVLLLALGGAIFTARSPQRGTAGLFLGTGISALLVVLAYDRFHERMLLTATVCLIPLSAFLFVPEPSLARARRKHSLSGPIAAGTCLLVLVLLWWHALLSASVPPETQVLETRIAARVTRLPFDARALFIAEQPTVLAAAGLPRVMATERALGIEADLRQRIGAGQPVYFLCDMYCESGFHGAASPPLCSRMVERFALSPVAEETLHDRTYALLRVSEQTAGESAPHGCPVTQHPSAGQP